MPPAADGGDAVFGRLHYGAFVIFGGFWCFLRGLWVLALGKQPRFLPVLQAVGYRRFVHSQPRRNAGGIHRALPLPQRQQQHLELLLGAEFQISVGHRGGDGKNAAPWAKVNFIGHGLLSSLVIACTGRRSLPYGPQAAPAAPGLGAFRPPTAVLRTAGPAARTPVPAFPLPSRSRGSGAKFQL